MDVIDVLEGMWQNVGRSGCFGFDLRGYGNVCDDESGSRVAIRVDVLERLRAHG